MKEKERERERRREIMETLGSMRIKKF